MRRTTRRLPRIGRATCVAVAAIVVVSTLLVGQLFRMSLTNFSEDPDALASLPYVLNAWGDDESLRTYPNDVVEAAVNEANDSGLGATMANAATYVGMAPEALLDVAPVVVSGRVASDPDVVFRALRTQVEVTAVYKGNGLSVGEEIPVFESYEIVEPDNLSGGMMLSKEREVTQTGNDATPFGLTPMRPGQEYLFFLEPKEYPESLDKSGVIQTYSLISHPYARISCDICDHPERVMLLDSPEQGTWRRTTVDEARKFDIVVSSEEAKQLYLDTCEQILARTV